MLAEDFATPCSEMTNPPVPPNIAYFLDHGLRDTGRWFVPLVLRLGPEVTVEDVRSVLTAVTNHHDALRVTIVKRAGTWEQQIAARGDFTSLSTRSLAPDTAAGGPAERDAILTILTELGIAQDVSNTPVSAAYIVGAHGGPAHLAIAVHQVAADNASREFLMTDILTAFRQRLAGQDIALEPVTMTWREWSQRCAGLATHPAILASRDYWLKNSAGATLRVADHDIADRPDVDDLARLSAPLSSLLTAELDGARCSLGLATEEILFAALGRTIARTIGEGVVSLDRAGRGRSVLEPDADLHRTVGWFTTVYPVPLLCVNPQKADAAQMLTAAHRTLEAVPHHGIGYGLLQYVYAPTALQLAAHAPSEIFFSYLGTVREPPRGEASVQFDFDAAMPLRETPPGLGHALELRAYRSGGLLHMDWWYDTRRFDPYTVEEFTEQFPLALIELTSEATPPIRDATEMAMVS